MRLAWSGEVPSQVRWFPAADDALILDQSAITTQGNTTTITQEATKLAGMPPGTTSLPMLITWQEADGTRQGVVLPVPYLTNNH